MNFIKSSLFVLPGLLLAGCSPIFLDTGSSNKVNKLAPTTVLTAKNRPPKPSNTANDKKNDFIPPLPPSFTSDPSDIECHSKCQEETQLTLQGNCNQVKDPDDRDDLFAQGAQPLPNLGPSNQGSSTITPITRPPILTEEHIKAISKLPISKKRALQKMYANLTTEVLAKWGQDGYAESSKHRYVKYLDNYLTRADIHFDTGKVYVSTISQDDPQGKLREAITQVLLMPPDPKSVDAFGDKAIEASTNPFFLGMILDEKGKNIQSKKEARNFANHLLKSQLQVQTFTKGHAYFVEISMAPDHMDKREYQYVELVKVAAKKYKVAEGLIYAVMRTESSFNPYAISSAGAYGLMQVMPKTAVADVYKLMKNDAKPPSKQQLFDPETNIDIGTAYLSLVRDRYLRDITEPTNRHFSMISAYNAGSGSVLEVFSKDRVKAAQIISKKSNRQVYQILVTEHPKEEARRYLQKVLSYQRDFDQNLLKE